MGTERLARLAQDHKTRGESPGGREEGCGGARRGLSPEGWDDEHRAFSPEWILTIFPYYSVTWEELKAPEQMRPLTEGGPDSKGPGPSAAWGHPLLHCASAVSEARWDIEALGDAVQRRGAGSEAEGTVVFGSWPCLGEMALRGRGHASPPRGAA